MSEKISVASLSPADQEGFLTKQGGSIKTWKRRWMVLKGPRLHYFKGKNDDDVQGVVELKPETVIREEPSKSSKKKFMFSVGTSKRTYIMYADEHEVALKWIAALKNAVDSLSKGPMQRLKALPAGVRASGGIPRSDVDEALQNGGALETAARVRLDALRMLIPYLKDTVDAGADSPSNVLEFWRIWFRSIPSLGELKEAAKVANEAALELGEAPQSQKIAFSVTASADMSKLTWRVEGPQSIFIQKMVDFFWNVGAPDVEIDILNEVGALINPTRIGSWIDMSDKNGMDGGWFFPGNSQLKLSLEAADSGDATKALTDWADENGISDCVSVGRDMGAAPPRQTEFRIELPGKTADAQLEVGLSAWSRFGFPSIPDFALEVLRNQASLNATGMILSVVTSTDGFVRIGLLQRVLSNEVMRSLCGKMEGGDAEKHEKFAAKAGTSLPRYTEFQHLNQGYGYDVYKEGFGISFWYDVGQDEV